MSTFLKGALAASLVCGFAAVSSAQSIAHWVDRQVHGGARHVTPRHHKPDEPVYYGRPQRMIVRHHTYHAVSHHRRHHHTWHR